MNNEIEQAKINLVDDMLTLESESSLLIHFADSDSMGIQILSNLILPEVIDTPKIGIGGARVRHKIGFHMGLSVSNFSFVTETGSDLETIDPTDINLVLWDYLNLSQPLARKILYRNWKRIDLITIVPILTDSIGTNLNLGSLITSGILGR